MGKNYRKETVKWTFPIENTVNKKEVEIRTVKKSKLNLRLFFKLFPPIAGAIVVGVLLGTFVLSYADKQLYTETSRQVNGAQVESEIIVPVVQAGVFSSQDAAEEMVNTLSSEITSEVVKQDGQYYVLLNVEPTIEQAKASEKDASKLGIDSYARDFKVTSDIASSLTQAQQLELSKIINNFYQILSVKGSSDTEEINGVELEKISDIGWNSEFSQILESYFKLEKTFGEYQKSNLPEETKSLNKQMLEFMAVFGGK